jgi:hypothetical protein
MRLASSAGPTLFKAPYLFRAPSRGYGVSATCPLRRPDRHLRAGAAEGDQQKRLLDTRRPMTKVEIEAFLRELERGTTDPAHPELISRLESRPNLAGDEDR